VRVLDDFSRGELDNLGDLQDSIETLHGDVRNYDAVCTAVQGCDMLWHLAYVNGTRFFYEKPELVLDVGIRGAINTLDAAIAAGVTRYVLASTGEVYNSPQTIPTPETERLLIPDVTNPRFSYSGGKIASELLALHYARKQGLEVVIFRPHNFYGPAMGFEHVIPEIIKRIVDLSNGFTKASIELPIQGDGSETRAFCFIDDGAHGAFIAGMRGKDGEIYHVGTQEEIKIADLVHKIAAHIGVKVELIPGPLREGGTLRRCPAIDKLNQLGYTPSISLDEGLPTTVQWYQDYFLSKHKISA